MKKIHYVYMIDFLIFISILLSLFSPLLVYSYSAVWSLASLILWLLFSLINKKQWGVSEIVTVFFYCYVVTVPYITGYGFIGNRYMAFSIFILGGLISNYCEYTARWDSIGTMLKMAAPFLAYVYFRTFQALLENPWNARMITENFGDYAVMMRRCGVGGYEFIYFLALLVSICVGMGFLLRNKRQKVFFFLLGIMAYMEIIFSNFMTALLIATVGIVLTVMMLLIKRNRAWIVFFAFGMFLIVFCGNSIISMLLDVLLEYMPHNGKTYLRLYSMKDSFFQELALTFFNERGDTIRKSINCFFAHPLLGIVGKIGLSREELLENIGQHSYFFDTFAFYGGIIGVFSIINYFTVFKKKFFDGNLSIITVPVLVSTLLLLLVNNVTVSIGVAIGIIYPYAIYILRKQGRDVV